jgi:hypothetical protein
MMILEASLKQAAGKVVVGAKGLPRALKRGNTYEDLTARLKPAPFQDWANVGVFLQLVKARPFTSGLMVRFLVCL